MWRFDTNGTPEAFLQKTRLRVVGGGSRAGLGATSRFHSLGLSGLGSAPGWVTLSGLVPGQL